MLFRKIEDDNTVSPKFLLKYILTNLLDVCIAAVKFLEMGVVNFKNPCVVTLEGSLLWLPFFLVFIFWQKTKKNWHFLGKKTKENQKNSVVLIFQLIMP